MTLFLLCLQIFPSPTTFLCLEKTCSFREQIFLILCVYVCGVWPHLKYLILPIAPAISSQILSLWPNTQGYSIPSCCLLNEIHLPYFLMWVSWEVWIHHNFSTTATYKGFITLVRLVSSLLSICITPASVLLMLLTVLYLYFISM